MGVDVRLWLNPKWKLEDVKDVLERTSNTPVTSESTIGSPSYHVFVMKDIGRMVHVHQSELPTGPATLLDMRSNPQGIQILRNVAEVFGGILQEDDSEERYEMIVGKMSENNGLPYFVKYAIMNDGIDPSNMASLVESIKGWEARVKSSAGVQF